MFVSCSKIPTMLLPSMHAQNHSLLHNNLLSLITRSGSIFDSCGFAVLCWTYSILSYTAVTITMVNKAEGNWRVSHSAYESLIATTRFIIRPQYTPLHSISRVRRIAWTASATDTYKHTKQDLHFTISSVKCISTLKKLGLIFSLGFYITKIRHLFNSYT